MPNRRPGDPRLPARLCGRARKGRWQAPTRRHIRREKFLQVKRIIERFRGREGTGELDRRWTAKVTDVRHWFTFSASERWREDGREFEHYADSGGKSGGQKEKLAYTVLAASLAYQFGLEMDAPRTRSFRFVVIDEAFGRGVRRIGALRPGTLRAAEFAASDRDAAAEDPHHRAVHRRRRVRAQRKRADLDAAQSDHRGVSRRTRGSRQMSATDVDHARRPAPPGAALLGQRPPAGRRRQGREPVPAGIAASRTGHAGALGALRRGPSVDPRAGKRERGTEIEWARDQSPAVGTQSRSGAHRGARRARGAGADRQGRTRRRASARWPRRTLEQLPELAAWLARKPLTALGICRRLGSDPGGAALVPRAPAVRPLPAPARYRRRGHEVYRERGSPCWRNCWISCCRRRRSRRAGQRNFEQRYGLASKPSQVRFRILDRRLSIQGLTDLAVPAREFASLDLPVERVFITENEINGLAFPALPGSLVIFGLGYGLDRLSEVRWLHDRDALLLGRHRYLRLPHSGPPAGALPGRAARF